MGKRFIDYLIESTKDYKYRLKFATEVTDDHLDVLERALRKYDLRSIGELKKTILQDHPMDFPRVRNVEVYILDISIGYPTTLQALHNYVTEVLNIEENLVVVVPPHSPTEIDSEQYAKVVSSKFKDEYEGILNVPYKEVEKVAYGEEYNSAFIKGLIELRKENPFNTEFTNDLIPEQSIEKPAIGEEEPKINTKAVIGGENDRGKRFE